jgi:uncharacterized membrane protein
MLPPAARIFADMWILSKIFEWFNPIMHNFQNNFSLFQYLIIILTGIIGLLMVYFFQKHKIGLVEACNRLYMLLCVEKSWACMTRIFLVKIIFTGPSVKTFLAKADKKLTKVRVVF